MNFEFCRTKYLRNGYDICKRLETHLRSGDRKRCAVDECVETFFDCKLYGENQVAIENAVLSILIRVPVDSYECFRYRLSDIQSKFSDICF